MDDKLKIVDLPGIYAMDTFSEEEKAAKMKQEAYIIIILD